MVGAVGTAVGAVLLALSFTFDGPAMWLTATVGSIFAAALVPVTRASSESCNWYWNGSALSRWSIDVIQYEKCCALHTRSRHVSV